jgi:hypothetical protein
MKKMLALFTFLVLSSIAYAQSVVSTVSIDWTWTSPGAATTITTNPAGTEISGPIWATMYHVLVLAGTSTCPAFSPTAWTELAPNQMAITTNATAGSSYVDNVASGSLVCFAITEQFQAGGLSTAALVSSPVSAVQPSSGPATPAMPTGLIGTVEP